MEDAAAADEHAALRIAFLHGSGQGIAEIRVIHGFQAVGAEVEDGKAEVNEVFLELAFELQTGMVAGDSDGFRGLFRRHWFLTV